MTSTDLSDTTLDLSNSISDHPMSMQDLINSSPGLQVPLRSTYLLRSLPNSLPALLYSVANLIYTLSGVPYILQAFY